MAAGRHNLTRRALLGAVVGASALPGAVAGAPVLLGAGRVRAIEQSRSWERALAAFRRAEARLAARRAYEAGLPDHLRAFPLRSNSTMFSTTSNASASTRCGGCSRFRRPTSERSR